MNPCKRFKVDIITERKKNKVHFRVLWFAVAILRQLKTENETDYCTVFKIDIFATFLGLLEESYIGGLSSHSLTVTIFQQHPF